MSTPEPYSGAADREPATVILGVGQDLFSVARMQNTLDRGDAGLLAAVLRPDELDRAQRTRVPARALAALFAAKEAVLKSLADLAGRGSFWLDIALDVPANAAVTVTLHGRLADLARRHGVHRVLVATAHDHQHATATALALVRPRAAGDR